MSVDEVLLDTTVQLGRIVYGPEETERFGQELHDKAEVYTTSFVFREFLNTIIADLEYVHIKVSEALKPDEDGRSALADLVRFFASGERGFHKRSIQRLHLVIAKLLEGFAQTKVPKDKILKRLEWVASRWIRDFFRYLDTDRGERAIICLTGLDDESDELEKMRRARPFPGRPRFPGVVAQFLEDRKALVERIEAEMGKKKNGSYLISKKRGRDDRLLQVLKWLKDKDDSFDFHGKLQEYKGWNWALGDMLIALETPENVAIYSTDRAFVILTRALGKPLYRGYRAPSPMTS